jgi:hypothetical protein
MAEQNCGMSSLTNSVAHNVTNCSLVMCHCGIHQENLCTKSLRMNVITVVFK